MPSEGVIQFALDHRTVALEGLDGRWRELEGWRRLLYRWGWLGRDPTRYGGLSYGNVSRRWDPQRAEGVVFLVSGSQTSAEATLDPDQYALVDGHSIDEGWISARGLVPPSSESLGHAAVYAASAEARFAFHVHAPALWTARSALSLDCTDEDAENGTIALAASIRDVVSRREARAAHGHGLIAFPAHRDGLMAYGRSAEEAFVALAGAQARTLAPDKDP